MKLLWLTDFFPKTSQGEITGGVEARCFYVNKFLKSKIDIKIIARKTSGEVWHPPSVSSFPERLKFAHESYSKAINSDFDIIEGTNFVTFPIAWLVGKIKKKPIVFWYPDVFVGSWVNNTGLSGYVGELIERISLKLPVDKYIAISNQTKEKLIKQGIHASKIEVIYCGIEQTKIKTKIIYDVCAVSRMLSYKRLEDLVRAGNLLKIKVVILGRGPENDKLKALASDTITFVDYLPKHSDVLKLIASAKVFCHPSIVEGFGISILEAMSLGKPVVVADLPVLHETTGDQGALFFRPRSAQSLSLQLKRLLTNKKLYNQKSKEAKQRATVFNWQDISEETLDLYKDLTSLKICMTTDAWRPVWGGGQEHILQISKILKEKYNCQVDILAPNLLPKPKNDEPNIHRLGPAFVFPNLLGRMLYLISNFKFQISNSYDIYHSHGSEAILLPIVKFFKPKSKVVYTVHGAGVDLRGGGLLNNLRILNAVSSLLVHHFPFDILMTAAKNTIKGKVSAKKFLVVGNGVNVEDYDKVKAKKTKNFKIIWIGRKTDPVKGVRFLEGAFKILKKKYPKFSMELVTNKFGKEKIEALKSSDIFVLPSLSEGLPLVLLEAMAAKLPIVTTDVGDCKMLIEKSRAGIVVPPGSAESLAKAIEKIYLSKNRAAMGNRGYDFVKKNYIWDKVTDKVIQVYYSLLKL